jgi:hypothetical protein
MKGTPQNFLPVNHEFSPVFKHPQRGQRPEEKITNTRASSRQYRQLNSRPKARILTRAKNTATIK